MTSSCPRGRRAARRTPVSRRRSSSWSAAARRRSSSTWRPGRWPADPPDPPAGTSRGRRSRPTLGAPAGRGTAVSENPRDETAAQATLRSGRPPEPSVPEYSPPPEPEHSAWGGWVTFAGITLVLMGVIHVVEGLVAVLEPEKYLVGSGGLVLHLDYTVWGWIHLVLGVVLAVAGVGVLNRNTVSRFIGVAACGVSALVHLTFLDAAPVWAITAIALAVVFIYAVTVHGGEVPVNRGDERTTGFTGPGAP